MKIKSEPKFFAEKYFIYSRDMKFVAVANDSATAKLIASLLSSHTQNLLNSPVESESGNASGECVCAESLTNGGSQ